MAEYVLINETYIKAYAPITSAVDANLIRTSTVLAQDKWIKPRVGDALMRKLKTDAQAGTLAGLYATLVNDYLRKALVWATMTELMNELYVRKDNGAPQIHTSEGTTTIDQNDFHRDKSAYRDNMQHYIKEMTDWLCVYGSQMPEYNQSVAPDKPPTSEQVFNQNGMTISSGFRGIENISYGQKRTLD